MKLDANGYAPSILTEDLDHCYLCGRRDRKLDRHEVFGASNRQKSKSDGLWVPLCHVPCHEGKDGVHGNAEIARELKHDAQQIAMDYYGWSTEEFIRRYGKNWL